MGGNQGAGMRGPAGARWRVWGMLAAALALSGVALLRAGFDPPALVGIAFVACVTGPLWATDAREHRLPNGLVLPGYAFAVAGLLWQWLGRGSPPWQALTCCAATLVVFAAFAVSGGLGMGDVKLAGLLALVWGAFGDATGVIASLGLAFVAAGVVAVAVAVGATLTAPGHPDARRRDIPLGPFLLAGFWSVGLWTVGR